MKKVVGALFYLLVAMPGYGYLYKDKDVYTLRKWNPERQRYRYWVGFCDFHDKTNKANFAQRRKIEELLPQRARDSFHVQVEDLSSPNDEGRLGCGSFYINSSVGILAGLASFCKEHAVPVQNVEYRYCRVVALGPVINNIAADPFIFPSTKRMMISHLMQEIEQTYSELMQSNDNPIFKNLLSQKFQEIADTMKKMDLWRYQSKSIADYLSAFSLPMQRLDIVKNLLTFDGILIGFKLVDGVIKVPDKDMIVAFAGGTHIAEEYALLQRIDGWEPIKMGNHPLERAASVSQDIAAPAVGYGIKPAPLSIELLEHYLKN